MTAEFTSFIDKNGNLIYFGSVLVSPQAKIYHVDWDKELEYILIDPATHTIEKLTEENARTMRAHDNESVTDSIQFLIL